MGMNIYFYKIISKEEHAKLESEDNKRKFRIFDNHILKYQNSFGNVEYHTKKEALYDYAKAFKNIGLDINNYDWVYGYDELIEYEHLTTKEKVNVPISVIPVHFKDVKYVCAKTLKDIRVGLNNEEFDIFYDIDEMCGEKAITKERFEKFLNAMPKLREIVYEKYGVDKDLDYDLFEVGW